MTSTRSRTRTVVLAALALAAAALAHACGLERPPDPPPFDCSTIDRAADRFPDECGSDAGDVDAGPDLDAGTDVDAGS